VVENSPYSDHADDAIYAIAGHHFRKGQYEEAAAQYRRLYTEYPESEWATISQYQAAMCAKRRSQGYEYAAEDLETARRQLEEYGAEHPESMESRSIDTQLASIDEELARKMWDTVRFYERVGKLHSAAYCCRRLEARFPDTSYARLAQAWLAEHPDQGGGDEEEGGEVPPPPADEIMDDAGDR
jgi:outer membrane protein assembly factor BamD (BamD/ComL family)